MEHQEKKEISMGVASGIGAYLIWGFLPIYWKFVDHVPPFEVLAHRIVWSLLIMLILLLVTKKFKALIYDLRYLAENPKIVVGILLAALFISINWVIFIWAVANDRIVEVSLGYYINPLFNVLLGVIFFKETLHFWQRIAVGLAFTGVAILTFSFGEVPYIALLLAVSFGCYGLVKKQTKIGAMTGLTLETLLLTPIALGFLFWIHRDVSSILHLQNLSTGYLLIGTGIATAVPLLLFGIGAQKIPFSLIGFLQYIAPTIMLILGVIFYNEPFTIVHVVSFAFIWVGLVIYSIGKSSFMVSIQPKQR
ncbi:protein RarD [Salipaludibacillus neizhouensis]|uniref:Protein RarD n=1 Tax=Salipaludibacillus neizhouensis TaxID=885475 RepID=A0A3A9KAC2_9BACI|nr:EamA family transporter RarD [Salipaludibacillus neizhouensis]RKL67700.1 protein RarD [Salipaludibacillus neizhouensis]